MVIMENHNKMDDLGVPLFSETTIFVLDDGWPESVEEQGLLLLVWRHYITR